MRVAEGTACSEPLWWGSKLGADERRGETQCGWNEKSKSDKKNSKKF